MFYGDQLWSEQTCVGLHSIFMMEKGLAKEWIKEGQLLIKVLTFLLSWFCPLDRNQCLLLTACSRASGHGFKVGVWVGCKRQRGALRGGPMRLGSGEEPESDAVRLGATGAWLWVSLCRRRYAGRGWGASTELLLSSITVVAKALDSAFLCFDCDLHVHSANFLVARHIRLPLCNGEQEENDQSSSSSSSDCISSTDHGSCSATKTTTKIASSDWKTREVLETWCSRLGISNKVTVAEAAFQVWWLHRSRIWPYRVALAASLWLGLLRSSNNKRIRMSALLKRLEEISGVPAKSIVIAQSRLANTSKMVNVEESCDEC
ncbi:hypothetical protein Tco_0007415 [Tanacetum coccineum]